MTNCGKLIINELLCFVQNKVNVMNEFSLISVCTESYSVGDVEEAEEIIYRELGLLRSNVERERKLVLQNIIKIIKEKPAGIPVFVAKDLRRLPQVSPSHINISSLLNYILVLKRDVDVMKRDYVKSSELEDLRKQMQSRPASVSVQTQTDEEQRPKPTINYGTGMACSFFQGYLDLIIPSDGKDDGFVEKIRKWENKQGVIFPVKKLLLVITKSLYCPPDLREFNEPNRDDWPQIEPCVDKSLEEVKKDVAGVKNRCYSNTTYVIKWPNHQHAPVYLAAECATPLHTLFGVLNNHQLYRELVNADKEALVRDFVQQLQNILDRSPSTQRKSVQLVFFDDSKDSKQYLPNVLLQKIEELQSNYRELIAGHDAEQSEEPAPIEIPPRVLRPGPSTGGFNAN